MWQVIFIFGLSAINFWMGLSYFMEAGVAFTLAVGVLCFGLGIASSIKELTK